MLSDPDPAIRQEGVEKIMSIRHPVHREALVSISRPLYRGSEKPKNSLILAARACGCVCVCVYLCLYVCVCVCVCVCVHACASAPLYIHFSGQKYGQTNGPTYQQTNGPMDQ